MNFLFYTTFLSFTLLPSGAAHIENATSTYPSSAGSFKPNFKLEPLY